MNYKSPTNRIAYWKVIDDNWDDINHILNVYLPTFLNKWIDGTRLDCSLGDHILKLKEDRNPSLVRAFSVALYNMPEDVGVWNYAALNKMQDLLLNEVYMHEDKEED